MAQGMVKAVFWVEVVNWGKFNPRKDVKKTSWFRMENDLLENPQFDDFSPAELVTWWFILSQCSRAQTGLIKCSLEKLQRNRGIPVEVSWGAVEKLIELGAINIREGASVAGTLHGRDVSVSDASQLRNGSVVLASHLRHDTNVRTNEDARDEHEDLSPHKNKNLNPAHPIPPELNSKSTSPRVGDNSQNLPDNFGGGEEDLANEVIDGAIAKGRIRNAIGMIRSLPPQRQAHYRAYLEQHDPGGKLFQGETHA